MLVGLQKTFENVAFDVIGHKCQVVMRPIDVHK